MRVQSQDMDTARKLTEKSLSVLERNQQHLTEEELAFFRACRSLGVDGILKEQQVRNDLWTMTNRFKWDL